MEVFTNFLKDVLKGFGSLHLLARIVRIGPQHMMSLSRHSATNMSALIVLAVLFVISINFYSPANPIGPVVGMIATLLSVVLIGVVGFFVNLGAPAERYFTDAEAGGRADNLANKWSTYLLLNLVIMIFVFIALNVISQLTVGDIAVSALINGFGLTWGESVFATVLVDRI